jgi:hypothetical protein
VLETGELFAWQKNDSGTKVVFIIPATFPKGKFL